MAPHTHSERNIPGRGGKGGEGREGREGRGGEGGRGGISILHKEMSVAYLIPFAHTALLSFVSMRTSGVLICFSANFLIALMARGARFLKPLWGEECDRDVSLEATFA